MCPTDDTLLPSSRTYDFWMKVKTEMELKEEEENCLISLSRPEVKKREKK